MIHLLLTVLFAFVLAELVSAQVTPLSPGPNETYFSGKYCQLSWQPDTTGLWKNMTIGDDLSVILFC